MKSKNLKLLTFICPPLAVALKCGQFTNFYVFLSILLTLAFWIPGVVFAYMFCFILKSKNKVSEISPASGETANSVSSTILYNPTPVHPKAKEIISFPTTLNSVVIHIPTENPRTDYFDYYENNQRQQKQKQKNLEENINKERVVKI